MFWVNRLSNGGTDILKYLLQVIVLNQSHHVFFNLLYPDVHHMDEKRCCYFNFMS